jgi:hypothetical protein
MLDKSSVSSARHRPPRTAALLMVGALIVGCGGQTPQSPTPATTTGGSPSAAATAGTTDGSPGASTVGPTLPPEMVTDYVIDADTGEPMEIEEPVPGPVTYDEVVDAGIEAGRWDELTGLELVLGYTVGAVSRDEVPGVESVVAVEFNDLLYRADGLLRSGEYSDDQMSGLRRWYQLAVPTPEEIERLAASAAEASGTTGVATAGLGSGFAAAALAASAAVVAQNDDCVPVDPEDFSSWAVVEGCYRLLQDSVAGFTMRVLYPVWYEDDPLLADLPYRAREALLLSAETYAPLAEVGDIDLIFSLTDQTEDEGDGEGTTAAIANDDATWELASRGAACPITIFPRAFAHGFEATVAHEAWHCVQREAGYPRGVDEGHAWYREGGAEYFSYLVYPSTDGFGNFDKGSRTKALYDLSYEAWVWWQYLGSRESPRAIADLHKQMSQTSDGGRGLIEPYSAIFHRFVIELVAGTIPAPGGGTLPEARYAIGPFHTVGKDDTGKELEFEAEAFVAKRTFAIYDEKLRVFESEASDPGTNVSMVEATQRNDLAAWKGVFPEVRSKCDNKINYWIVATPEEGKKTGKIKIDTIEEAVCDPCLLGTWDLDLDSFQSMIMSAIDTGGGMPPGASFDIAGNYYIAFDDEAGFREQRDNLTIRSSFQGFSMDIVIDSFAHGTYSADGENLEVTNLVDDYVNVSMGGQTFAQDSRVLDGAGTYVCGTDDMTITVESFEPVQWTRVDKILEPPPSLEGAP